MSVRYEEIFSINYYEKQAQEFVLIALSMLV